MAHVSMPLLIASRRSSHVRKSEPSTRESFRCSEDSGKSGSSRSQKERCSAKLMPPPSASPSYEDGVWPQRRETSSRLKELGPDQPRPLPFS